MDKINIVSSQAVLVVSSFSTDTRSKSSSPLVSSLVKNRLFKTAPNIDELPFQVIHAFVSGRHDAAWQSTFAPASFRKLSSFLGAVPPVPFWILQVFDQNLIFVAQLIILRRLK